MEEKVTLLEQWRNTAYSQKTEQESNLFWAGYFNLEKEIYKKILINPEEIVEGTVKELAEKFEVPLSIMVGFLDGINDSLVKPNPIKTMEEDTKVSLGYEKELLYKNMVEAKADWLYSLEEWEPLIPEERRKALYLEQKKSHTVVKEKKAGRNDPCPCGSGKKFKACCGK